MSVRACTVSFTDHEGIRHSVTVQAEIQSLGYQGQKLEAQLAEALSMMASALRVGHSFAAALGAVAQECPEP